MANKTNLHRARIVPSSHATRAETHDSHAEKADIESICWKRTGYRVGQAKVLAAEFNMEKKGNNYDAPKTRENQATFLCSLSCA